MDRARYAVTIMVFFTLGQYPCDRPGIRTLRRIVGIELGFSPLLAFLGTPLPKVLIARILAVTILIARILAVTIFDRAHFGG